MGVYSLKLFLPFRPAKLTVLVLIALFTANSLRGGENAGCTKVFLAGVLLASVAAIAACRCDRRARSPGGFGRARPYKDNGFCIHGGSPHNVAQNEEA